MNFIFMNEAIKEAKIAYQNNDIPIGAVIVKDGKIIAKAHNTKNNKNCSIYHAEINAILKAAKKMNNWRLQGCEMYVTYEPCPMCASAIRQSRILKVYCGLKNDNCENEKIIQNIFNVVSNDPIVSFENNLFPDEISAMMSDFFRNIRSQ